MNQTLPKFKLSPQRDSYNLSLASNLVSTQVEAGPPRQRKDSIGKFNQLTPNFRCDASEYAYLINFLNVNAGKPFLMQLELESTELKWYECHVIGDFYPVNDSLKNIWDVQLQIVAKPPKIDKAREQALATLYNFEDDEITLLVDVMNQLVNFALPTKPMTLGSY